MKPFFEGVNYKGLFDWQTGEVGESPSRQERRVLARAKRRGRSKLPTRRKNRRPNDVPINTGNHTTRKVFF